MAKLFKCNSERPRPHVIGLLAYHRVTIGHIQQASGRSYFHARRVLDINTFGAQPLSIVVSIRAATERLLREAGWQGEPSELWAEYDAALRERSAA